MIDMLNDLNECRHDYNMACREVERLNKELAEYKRALELACHDLKSITEDICCSGDCHDCGSCEPRHYLSKAKESHD